jgi:hypothetical protein
MTGWARTTEGFAANLDGSDAARQMAFPRLELRSGPAGWECRCLLPDGSAVDTRGHPASTSEAKAAVVQRARAVLGPAWAAALDALSGPTA